MAVTARRAKDDDLALGDVVPFQFADGTRVDLAVRAIPADARTRATRCAIIGLVAVVNIPIVHKAVDWWRGLHQGRTVLGTIDPEMGGTQLFAMYASLLAGILVLVWLLIHRFRVGFLAERAADEGLDVALAERRLEGGSSTTTTGATS